MTLKLFIVFAIVFTATLADELADLEKKWNYKFDQLQDHFARNISILMNDVEKLKNQKPNNNNETSCGDGWTSYLDTKCFKVLSKKGTEEEAKANCTQLDSTSTLITIGSKEEQTFLSNLLQKSSTVSENAWIGLEYSNKAFKWVDSTDLKYENWGENAIKDGSSGCVQMSLGQTTLGKWTDDSCKKKYLFVCQKKASTKTVLSQEVDNLSKKLKSQQDVLDQLKLSAANTTKLLQDQENKLDTKLKSFNVSSVPIGFIYTQLPKQAVPADLWPSFQWSEVTKEYAGLFFRAEGGSSSTFGQVQKANQSSIIEVKASSIGWQSSYYKFDTVDVDVEQGEWTSIESKEMAISHIWLYKTKAENRPQNTAIKFWKRTQ